MSRLVIQRHADRDIDVPLEAVREGRTVAGVRLAPFATEFISVVQRLLR